MQLNVVEILGKQSPAQPQAQDGLTAAEITLLYLDDGISRLQIRPKVISKLRSVRGVNGAACGLFIHTILALDIVLFEQECTLQLSSHPLGSLLWGHQGFRRV